MLKSLKNKLFNIFNPENTNSELNIIHCKPYGVVREDGTIIHQFNDFYNASAYSNKLNICYKENDINDKSKVIKLSV